MEGHLTQVSYVLNPHKRLFSMLIVAIMHVLFPNV